MSAEGETKMVHQFVSCSSSWFTDPSVLVLLGKILWFPKLISLIKCGQIGGHIRGKFYGTWRNYWHIINNLLYLFKNKQTKIKKTINKTHDNNKNIPTSPASLYFFGHLLAIPSFPSNIPCCLELNEHLWIKVSSADHPWSSEEPRPRRRKEVTHDFL